MSVAVAELEQVFLTPEAAPGTLIAVSGAEYIDVEVGSVNVEHVGIKPSERNDAGPRLATKAGAAPAHYYSQTGIKTPFTASATAGAVTPWGKILKAAGWTETIVGGVSVTYGFPVSPNVPANDYALSLQHEIPGHKVYKSHGMRASDIVIELPEEGFASMSGRLTGGYNAEVDWAANTAPTEDAGALQSLLDAPANFPFRFDNPADAVNFDVLNWRVRVPMRVGMRKSKIIVGGYKLPPVVSRGAGNVLVEFDVLAPLKATYDFVAKGIAATLITGNKIILVAGARKTTINLYGIQWSAQPDRNGNPRMSRLVASCHWDGTNQPCTIVCT